MEKLRLAGQPTKLPRVKRRSSVGQVVLTSLCVLVLFLSCFTAFEVPVATERNLFSFFSNKLQVSVQYLPEKAKEKVFAIYPALNAEPPAYRSTYYSPVPAAAVFVGYVLGPSLGMVSCAVFLFIGLVGPLVGVHTFAGGGGLGYYQEPGFGYLLALIPSAWVVGMITRGRRTTLSQSIAVLAGLTVTHLTGLLYLFGSVLVSYMLNGTSAALAWQPWVFELARNMTWYQLPYDAIAAVILIGIGFPFRWLAGTLTAPDLAARPAPGRESRIVSVDAFADDLEYV